MMLRKYSLFLIFFLLSCGVQVTDEVQPAINANYNGDNFTFNGFNVGNGNDASYKYEWTFAVKSKNNKNVSDCVTDFTLPTANIYYQSSVSPNCSTWYAISGNGQSPSLAIAPEVEGPIVLNYCLRILEVSTGNIVSSGNCGTIDTSTAPTPGSAACVAKFGQAQWGKCEWQ